jgi:serine/threonine-protein kinase
MTNYVGRTLGPYKLEAPLGKGGMAAVYRAYQASVKRYVAIKVMAPEVAEQAGFVERFEREAQMIASLEHPHILPVIDYGLADGLHYIVMRYIEGGSLDERMRRKQLSLQECARFLTQIASALDYAHRKGVVHRDLKPNNVLLDSDENSYLTDFGIARLTQSQTRLTATGSVMGTPAYMSPEQAMGRPVDGRSDIYTLGVMLYEMVLNKLPFAADTPAALIFQHVYERPPAPRSIEPDISDSVALVLDRAMAKSPDARYQLAADLASAFAEAINYRSSTPQKSAPAVGGPSMDMEKTAPITTPGRAGTPVERENTLIDVDGSRRTPGSVAPGQAPWQPTRQPEYAPPSMPAQQPGARRQSPAQSIPAIPAEMPARQGLPLGLVVIGVVVILLVIGGGALAIISNSNSASATQAAVNTAQAAVAITQTNIAIAVVQTNTRIAELSRTPTPTATPSAANHADSFQYTHFYQYAHANGLCYPDVRRHGDVCGRNSCDE